MKRAYYDGAAPGAPAATAATSEGYPTEGDIGLGIAATIIGPFWFHMVTEAIVKVIEQAGLDPSHDPNQFRDALLEHFATRTGLTTAINALVGGAPANRDTLKKLADAIATLDIPDAVALATNSEHTGENPPSTKAATPAGVRAVRDALVGGAPANRDTLKKLADAIAVNAAAIVAATFTPSKSNLYAAVKSILHPEDQPGLTADDTDNELDLNYLTDFALERTTTGTGDKVTDVTLTKGVSGGVLTLTLAVTYGQDQTAALPPPTPPPPPPPPPPPLSPPPAPAIYSGADVSVYVYWNPVPRATTIEVRTVNGLGHVNTFSASNASGAVSVDSVFVAPMTARARARGPGGYGPWSNTITLDGGSRGGL